jgi:hypothetical protein
MLGVPFPADWGGAVVYASMVLAFLLLAASARWQWNAAFPNSLNKFARFATWIFGTITIVNIAAGIIVGFCDGPSGTPKLDLPLCETREEYRLYSKGSNFSVVTRVTFLHRGILQYIVPGILSLTVVSYAMTRQSCYKTELV